MISPWRKRRRKMALLAVLMPILSCSSPSSWVLRPALSTGESTRLSLWQLVFPLPGALCGQELDQGSRAVGANSDPIPAHKTRVISPDSRRER